MRRTQLLALVHSTSASRRTLTLLSALVLWTAGCSDQPLAPEIQSTPEQSSSIVATANGIDITSIDGPPGPVAVNTPVQISAHFTGDVGDTHSGAIRWGDGASSVAVVTEAEGIGAAVATRSYVVPGVYTVEVDVANQSQESVTGTFEYVTVYDPDGGYVSGNGAILSPAGACTWGGCVTEEGDARFGFSSRYRRGATVPDGSTRFTFRDGNFSFTSTQYEWLVIAGARAQYKGVGTVNRIGNYGFMLTAVDSDMPGGGDSDRFRIKIWDRDAGDEVVYDNQSGDDDADLTGDGTLLTRGNITIRTTKQNTAPVVIITSPADGATFLQTEGIALGADAGDAEDGDLSASVVWTSDLAGELGVGAEVPDVTLEPGTHAISASVVDSEGLEGSASLAIEVLDVTISVSPSEATIAEGGTQAFVATVYAGGADMGADAPAVAWKSSDESIATVNVDGLATGLSPGEATVTARVGDISDGVVLSVEEVPAGPDILAETITGGTWHTCGLAAAGDAYCWGDNSYGQLGNSSNTSSTSPVAVTMPAGATFNSISAGETYTLALTPTGEAYGWGNNQSGQLGDGTGSNSNVPMAVKMPEGVTFASIRGGANHAIALASTGAAYAWGYNYSGELGDGTNTTSKTPTAIKMPGAVSFISVDAGNGHSVALTSAGEAYTWGDNRYGQLGVGTTGRSNIPVAVTMPVGVSFSTVAAGSYHTLALTLSGAAYAWGHNGYGQVGDGGTATRYTPTAAQMPGGVSFTSVNAGVYQTVALASTGAAYAWGHNSYGQLGNGTQTHSYTPTRVSLPAAVSFTSIGAGLQHTMAIASTGEGYAWGLNNAYQLGDGTNTNRNVPVAVQGGITFAH